MGDLKLDSDDCELMMLGSPFACCSNPSFDGLQQSQGSLCLNLSIGDALVRKELGYEWRLCGDVDWFRWFGVLCGLLDLKA